MATFINNYTGVKPYDGGMEIHMVIAMDIAGSIPGFIKNTIAKRLSNVGLQTTDYIMHGTVPKSLF